MKILDTFKNKILRKKEPECDCPECQGEGGMFGLYGQVVTCDGSHIFKGEIFSSDKENVVAIFLEDGSGYVEVYNPLYVMILPESLAALKQYLGWEESGK